MTLDDLANLGEIVGAIAVLVTLIYLAIQLRQNTSAIKAQTYQEVYRDLRESLMYLDRDFIERSIEGRSTDADRAYYELFLLVSLQVIGQQSIFKGKLADKISKEPVVYANISFFNSDKGISSQEDGTFRMYIDEKLLKSKIHISCLNYKDTVLLAEDLQGKTLFLEPKVIELDELQDTILAKVFDALTKIFWSIVGVSL